MRAIPKIPLCIFSLLFFLFGTASANAANEVYVSYFIENGSPLDWNVGEDGTVNIQLLYDHERNSPNRACIHWNFLVEAEKEHQRKTEWHGKQEEVLTDAQAMRHRLEPP